MAYFYFHYSADNLKKKIAEMFEHDSRAAVYYIARAWCILCGIIIRSDQHSADLRAEGGERNSLSWFYINTLSIWAAYIFKERAPYVIDEVNAPRYAARYFQRPATEMMSNIIDFHNDLMVVLIFISIFIFVLLSACLYHYSTVSLKSFYLDRAPVSRMTHEPFVEVAFTVVPAFIVYSIAAHSFALLYSNNDWLERDTELTISVTGHQWY
jgi:hypothetical protein